MLNEIENAWHWINNNAVISTTIATLFISIGGSLFKYFKLCKRRKASEQKLTMTSDPIIFLPRLERKEPRKIPLIFIPLIIKNPTKKDIRIKQIRLIEESPFELIAAMVRDPISIGFSRIDSKCICFERNLIKPQRSIQYLKKGRFINPPLEQLLELFNLKSRSELSLTLCISPLSSSDIVDPEFFIRHTAPYNPKKTIEVSFCPVSFNGLKTWEMFFEIAD